MIFAPNLVCVPADLDLEVNAPQRLTGDRVELDH